MYKICFNINSNFVSETKDGKHQTVIPAYFNPSGRVLHFSRNVNLQTKRIGPQTMITTYFKPYPKFKPTGIVTWTELTNEAINPAWVQAWKKYTRIPSSSLLKAAVLNSLESKRARRYLKQMSKKYDGPNLPSFTEQIRVMRDTNVRQG